MAELNTKEELFGVITTNETIEGNINPSGKIVASMIAPKGVKGDPGVTPTIGENGNWYLGDTDTGKPSKGEKGDKGDKGEKGDAGEQGIQGIQGPQGEKGDTGPQGIQGLQGPQGEKGDTGPQGLQGEKGETGSTGNGIESITLSSTSGKIKTYTILFTNGTTTTFNVSDGEEGPIGHDGKGLEFNWSGTQLGVRVEGTTEYTYVDLKGSKGDKGDKGEKGDKGDTGEQGIQGVKGETGQQGIQGIQGEKGDKGDKGEQGPQGEKGDAGYSIGSVTKKSGTGAAGTTDVYSIKLNDANSTEVGTFNVYNGANGEGSGDMTKNDYDSNSDGIVNAADKLSNGTYDLTMPTLTSNKIIATTDQIPDISNKVDKVDGKGLSTNDLTDTLKSNYDTAYKNSHTHSNKSILDNTTASYTTEKDTKLSSLSNIKTIGSGLELNSETGELSNTQTSANWGNITGTLSNQTDLQNALNNKQNTISDLDTIRSGASLGATALQSETDPVFSASPSSGITSTDITNWNNKIDSSYHDNTKVDKVDGKGLSTNDYTTSEKNKLAGLSNYNDTEVRNLISAKYTKPSSGIPKTDLTSAVQTSLEKADSALQSYTETDPVFSTSAASNITSTDITNWNNKSTFSGNYNDLTNKPKIPSKVSELTNDSGFTTNTGTITGITMNGASKGTSGVVNLGTVITSHQVHNAYSTKTTDTYSCNYINENIGDLTQLNTNNKNNLVSAINEVNANVNNLKSVQLYSYTGTNKQTSITLNDSYSNYKFIEIYGQRNAMHGFIKMNTTDSNVIDFNIVGQNNGYMEISSSHMTFNNTSVKLTGNVIVFDTTTGAVAGHAYDQENIIRKIYGYKDN